VFTADGRYVVEIYRAERTRFASNDRSRGTPEEYKDASLSISTHFGRYTVDQAKGTTTFAITSAFGFRLTRRGRATMLLEGRHGRSGRAALAAEALFVRPR
jgi:hypothetical protein